MVDKKIIKSSQFLINCVHYSSNHAILDSNDRSFMKKINLIIGIINLFVFGALLLSFESNEEVNNVGIDIKSNYQVGALQMPSKLTFAGETVPMNDIDVRERMDRELLINTYWHSSTLISIKRSSRYFPIIEKILAKNDIPEDFKYLALIESGFDAHAASSAGAVGFWQFLKATGKECGLEINEDVDERKHIEKSTEAACVYLKKAYKKLGSWSLVAGSYNAGVRRIQTQLDAQKVDNYYDLYLNSETSRYLFRVLAIKEVLNSPSKYGFNITKRDLYLDYDYEIMEVDNSIEDLTEFAIEHKTTYKMLKILNPWLKQPWLRNSTNKHYQIKVVSK